MDGGTDATYVYDSLPSNDPLYINSEQNRTSIYVILIENYKDAFLWDDNKDVMAHGEACETSTQVALNFITMC